MFLQLPIFWCLALHRDTNRFLEVLGHRLASKGSFSFFLVVIVILRRALADFSR